MITDTATAVPALAALAHADRLAAWRLLVTAGPEGMASGEIARRLAIAPTRMSFHLAALERSGLACRHRAGREIRYAADYDAMRDLLGFLTRDCCAGHPDICAAIALPDCPPPSDRLSPTDLAAPSDATSTCNCTTPVATPSAPIPSGAHPPSSEQAAPSGHPSRAGDARTNARAPAPAGSPSSDGHQPAPRRAGPRGDRPLPGRPPATAGEPSR
ncbi:helix-turn-helix domain-containing protein [Paroceanicella profunda]|uniref:Helix-turn-helix domain-containing protein n=1 Tax=Paroceanicella profunda TaxID=2579971 RepID=A0A5B8FTM7_9RHOB|nr:helix-turn-helix transcriptional regulator [Paroceanicella profunda]QDL90654.1 helix-turn-helix domain-containing protein [Paroceanicella profunda]